MAEHPGWYPPGQVCYPPELPAYLKNVCDLKPVVGVPSDAEVMRIHSVMHAANRVSGVPGMHDAGLFMNHFVGFLQEAAKTYAGTGNLHYEERGHYANPEVQSKVVFLFDL
ncbi:hypothetical protein RSAG8_13121, partial [Rhizoctonia solani AG-8 WAC10335]